jgi:arsenite-transporting ATPase
LSSQPRRIRPGLDAVELDAPRAFARWLKEHRRPLGQILENGTWLDTEDVDALLNLSIPGVDELVGILEIANLAAASYDLIVVDTAPTGHTLRLLAAPETVAAVADILDTLQQEHRVIREQLARVGRPEAADRLIVMLAGQARETAELLHDPQRTAFHWVTLPEMLSIAETDDAVTTLERTGMRVPQIIVNRVLPDAPPCPVCDRRRADQHRAIATLRRRLARGRRVRLVPAMVREPQGLAALKRFGAELTKDTKETKVRKDTTGVKTPAGYRFSAAASSNRAGGEAPPDSIDAFTDASLLFVGGKGGVGKTTVAAASALRLARADSDRRVLLLSTDPAHSLGDVFDSAVSDAPRPIPHGPRNLVVRELDAAAALDARRAQFESALDEIASAVGAAEVEDAAARAAPSGLSVRVPAAEVAGELMNLAPPGIDELFGILSVVDARAEYDVIVVDTAPTGHALRLLEMPDAAREWMRVLLRVLFKYRNLVRPGKLASELVDVSKSIRELQALLADAAQTRFIVVTRAAQVPRRETERLLARLRRLKLATPAVVFNALTMAPGKCARCRATASAERQEIDALRVPRGCVIIRTPLSAPPPRGAKALDSWAGHWITARIRRGTRSAQSPQK